MGCKNRDIISNKLWAKSYVDSLHLELGGSGVGSSGVNTCPESQNMRNQLRQTISYLFLTVLIGDDFPELCSDLVAALAGLEVDNFSHCDWWVGAGNK